LGDHIYEIIPLKNEIYICPDEDFNMKTTWTYLNSKLKDFSLFWFEKDIYNIYNYFYQGKKWEYTKTDEVLQLNNKLLKEDWKKIQEINVDKFYKKLIQKDKSTTIKNNINFINVSKDYDSFESMFNDLFNPEKNGFEKIKYTDFQKSIKYEDNEVWFNFNIHLELICLSVNLYSSK